MKKNKSMIVEMFRNWYFIDSALLDGHARDVIEESRDFEAYVTMKSSMLSCLYEYYTHIGYMPVEAAELNSPKAIQESAKQCAIKFKKVSARMLEHKDMMNHMKTVITTLLEQADGRDFTSIAESVARTRFNKMTLDNLLIGKPILESSDPDKASDFQAQILEQAYMTCRSELIDIAKNYKY